MMEKMVMVRISATAPESGSRFSKIRKWTARTLFFCGVLILVLYIASRIATDRWLYSQFLFWVPAWVYAIPVMLLLGLERISALRSQRPRWRYPSWWMILICAFVTAHVTWKWMHRSDPPPNSGALTVVHWNMSSPDMLNFQGTLGDFRSCRGADVIVLGVTVPDAQFKRMVAGLGEEWTYRRLGVFAVVSRFPIERASQQALGLQASGSRKITEKFQDFYNERIADRFGVSRREFDLPDPGYVLDIGIAAPGGPLNIRVLDLPSNPFRSRMEIARHAAERIGTLTKNGTIPAAPDIIIGDCNIPEGSASLELLHENLVSAQSLAQSGDDQPTWPRGLPLLRIDHAWVKSDTRVLNYRTFDGQISDHRGQSVTIQRGGL